MPQSYAQAYTDASSGAFIQRLAESLCAAAIAISNESAATALHNQRVALARQVLANPIGMATAMAPGITSDGVTGAASTDAQIDARVSAVWNSYAT